MRIDDAVSLLGLRLKPRGESLRGPCPACKSGGERALVVTPSKGAYYCFADKAGGDLISLVSHIRGCTMKDAARYLAGDQAKTPQASQSTIPKERTVGVGEKGAKKSLQPLTYLLAEHEAVQALGLEPETFDAFGCGYAPKGILRGRLAIPLHDQEGTLIAYCGRAVNGDSPALTFPKEFDPADVLFNAHRIKGPDLILVRDPLEALLAIQTGLDDVVSLLTETASAEQLRLLATLMDNKGCTSLELH